FHVTGVQTCALPILLHMPVRFRGAMSTGAYPYPFWHSEKKWDAYNYATTIHFVIQNGGIPGALRGTEQDKVRPKVAHTWDGLWQIGRASCRERGEGP